MTQQRERRYETILKLLQSVITYVVYFTAILAILSVMQVKVAGLLAGAGIVGLAVGFGAQSLVKDVITGFFIIFEDQFGVGTSLKLLEYREQLSKLDYALQKFVELKAR